MISYKSKSSVDKGVAIAENKFSVLSGWEDVRLCIGGQDQDCVVFDEITDGGLGLLPETTDAATEKRQENPFVGSK